MPSRRWTLLVRLCKLPNTRWMELDRFSRVCSGWASGSAPTTITVEADGESEWAGSALGW
jgi:hypothetical protein